MTAAPAWLVVHDPREIAPARDDEHPFMIVISGTEHRVGRRTIERLLASCETALYAHEIRRKVER